VGGENPQSTSPGLTVTAQLQDGVFVLAVAGELDMLTAPRLSQTLEEALADEPRLLVVDLSDVTFLDSAGLAALLAARREARTGTSLRVVANQRATLRPMQLTGVDEYLSVYASRRDALRE
jgi:anti-sigma B factor antagonist